MQEKTKSEWDEKKIQILKVSQQIFARYGFFKATVDDIAQAMGMKKGSLYYYYKSKDEIFSDVIHYESEQFLNELEKALSQEKDSRKKILRFVKFRLEYFQQVINLHQLTIQAILEIKPLVAKLYRTYIDKEVKLLANIIEEGVQKGSFKACNTHKVAKSILTVSEAVKFREFHTTNVLSATEIDYSSIEEEIVYITQLILEGLEKK